MKRKKASRVERYDLNRVYRLNEYHKAVDYGNRNIHISSVKAVLNELNDEKKREEERLKVEKQRLEEERRARRATEELLSIEKERERRYRGW